MTSSFKSCTYQIQTLLSELEIEVKSLKSLQETKIHSFFSTLHRLDKMRETSIFHHLQRSITIELSELIFTRFGRVQTTLFFFFQVPSLITVLCYTFICNLGLLCSTLKLCNGLFRACASLLEASSSSSCSACISDCSTEPHLSISLEGLGNTSIADCVKRDPDANEDMERNFTDLLSEELKLREADALDNHQRADMALLEAKKVASQYQKEADKCNSGMETCEEAREKAEAALVAQKRLTAMWELRARQRGWKDGPLKSSS